MDVPRILKSATNKAVVVGSGSTQVLAHNSTRGYATIVNDSDEAIYLAFAQSASLNSGTRLNPRGGSYEIGGGGDNYWGEVYAICSSGGKVLTVSEFNLTE